MGLATIIAASATIPRNGSSLWLLPCYRLCLSTWEVDGMAELPRSARGQKPRASYGKRAKPLREGHGKTQRFRHSSVSRRPRSGDAAPACPGFLTKSVVRRLAGTEGFVLLPRRWVAERTLGWLGRWRRLAREHEELPEVSETVVKPAVIRLMLHRLAHPNRKRLPAH